MSFNNSLYTHIYTLSYVNARLELIDRDFFITVFVTYVSICCIIGCICTSSNSNKRALCTS